MVVSVRSCCVVLVLSLLIAPLARADTNAPMASDWVGRIRDEHPRMFFTDETFEQVKAYALGGERAYYDKIRRTVEGLPVEPSRDRCIRSTNTFFGPYALMAAFVWRMEGDTDARDTAINHLLAAVDYYNECSSQRKAVNWYSASRVQALAAYDWLYDQLTPAQRRRVAEGFFRHYRDCLAGKRFERQNRSGITTGFYGPTNMAWYIGLAFHGDGIDDAQAARLLRKGYQQHVDLLTYRRKASGDDGGMGSVAAGYAFGMYPWAEFNFMHTYNSATDLKVEASFDHLSLLPNWVAWNRLPGHQRFGLGDSSPAGGFSDGFLEMHMLQVAHFYADRYPRRARQALWVRDELLSKAEHDTYWWPLAPLLVHRSDEVRETESIGDDLPLARNFEAMGVIFMRSDHSDDATCAAFIAGGEINQHRHYDQGHFAIYRGAHLTGNSGHYGPRERNDHLTEYFYRSVAANCLLIHAPADADRPAKVWGGPAKTLDGGQCAFGGKQIAFETHDAFTYAATDMTDCYASAKCRQAIRQVVFVHPDTFVVCDRVVTTDPDYRKVWLLHSIDEPALDGRRFRVEAGPSALVGTVVFPERAELRTVGGPGREFWSAGRNWPQDGEPRKAAGAWRVETSPAEPSIADVLLHVIRVGDRDAALDAEIRPIRTSGRAGVRFAGADGADVRLVFNTRGPVGGRILIDGDERISRPLTAGVHPQAGLAVTADDNGE
ncbi:MAG: hypothetical protein ACOC7R_04850 [Planctomycetota bacterium]